MGGPAGPDSAFLIERELFAQEQILGRERIFRSETENQEAKQIGKDIQPKQAEFYHGPMSFVFGLLPSNRSQFSPFQLTPAIFADDTIILAGQAVYQRSSLSLNHATYYIDTTVNQSSQENAIIPPPVILPANRNLSVFQKGMKFYVFLPYANSTSQQRYQLYVGKGFNRSDTKQLSLVQISPLSAPYKVTDLGALPAGWNPQLDANGILTVNVDMSKLPKFAAQYKAAKKSACQPVSFCTPKTTTDMKTTYCGCNLTDNPNDPFQHDLYKQCKDDPTTGYSPICGWAGKDVDCPEGGCYGFAVTLASGFSNTTRLAPPAVNCIKMTDSNFNISFKPVPDTVAGEECTYPSGPQGMFCK